ANVDHSATRSSVRWSENRGSTHLQAGIPQELRSRARGAGNGERDGQVVGVRMVDRQVNRRRSNGSRYGGCFNLDGRELPGEDFPRDWNGPSACHVDPRLFLEVLEAVPIGVPRSRIDEEIIDVERIPSPRTPVRAKEHNELTYVISAFTRSGGQH